MTTMLRSNQGICVTCPPATSETPRALDWPLRGPAERNLKPLPISSTAAGLPWCCSVRRQPDNSFTRAAFFGWRRRSSMHPPRS